MNSRRSDHSSDNEAIDTEAAAWICERDEGFGPGREAVFRAWRAADPRHAEAFDRADRAFALVSELPAIRVPLLAHLAVRESEPRRSPLRLPAWAVGLAAVLAIVAGVWSILVGRAGSSREYVTAAASRQHYDLADGSTLDLGVSSRAQVAFSRETRRVELTAGAAHFAVAHDVTRPFVVSAGGIRVRAVGTAFSVSFVESGIEVLVTEGKVDITDAGDASGPLLPKERPLLVAGERATFSSEESGFAVLVEQVPPGVVEDLKRAWSGVTTFADLPLRDAIVFFNQRNERKLILEDPEIGERRIGGTFAAGQVDAFVNLLARDGQIVVERRSSGEIILRRARP